jgi:hypothetical protein
MQSDIYTVVQFLKVLAVHGNKNSYAKLDKQEGISNIVIVINFIPAPELRPCFCFGAGELMKYV